MLTAKPHDEKEKVVDLGQNPAAPIYLLLKFGMRGAAASAAALAFLAAHSAGASLFCPSVCSSPSAQTLQSMCHQFYHVIKSGKQSKSPSLRRVVFFPFSAASHWCCLGPTPRDLRVPRRRVRQPD